MNQKQQPVRVWIPDLTNITYINMYLCIVACSVVIKHCVLCLGEGAGENVVQKQPDVLEEVGAKPKDATDAPDQVQAQGEPVHDVAAVEPVEKKPEVGISHNAIEPVQEEGVLVPKQEELPADKELGARGVPLRQRDPDQPRVNPDDIAEEEERVKQKLVQLEAEKERIEKERLEQERIEKEVQARVERERKERERREQLAREQELERVRQEKERLERERLEAERLKQEREKTEKEIMERAEKEKRVLEHQERLDQLQQVINSKNAAEKNDAPKEEHPPEPKKNGGRDLKENVVPQVEEKVEKRSREDGGMDLRRRRRDVNPQGGGLDPLLDLRGSDLHAALEGRLLAGAQVHTRQLKQTFQSQENED